MKDFKDATVLEKLDRMIEFLEKWNESITIVPDDKKYLIEIKDLIEKQQKEIEELKRYEEGYKLLSYSLDNYISKDKIRAKIEELEKEQENNRKSLYNAINILYFKEIDKISNRISVNMTVRDILQSLLEKE